MVRIFFMPPDRVFAIAETKARAKRGIEAGKPLKALHTRAPRQHLRP